MAPTTPTPKARRTYTEEALEAACQSVRKDGKSSRLSARLHGVPPSTLNDRLKGKKARKEVQTTILTEEEEDRLVAWLAESSKRDFTITKQQILSAAQNILNDSGRITAWKDNKPGQTWFCSFLARHSELCVAGSKGLGMQAVVTVDRPVSTDVTDEPTVDMDSDGQASMEVTDKQSVDMDIKNIKVEVEGSESPSPSSSYHYGSSSPSLSASALPRSPSPPTASLPLPSSTCFVSPNVFHANSSQVLTSQNNKNIFFSAFQPDLLHSLDLLLDLAATGGTAKLIHRRSLLYSQVETSDPEALQFLTYYSQLRTFIDNATGGDRKDNISLITSS